MSSEHGKAPLARRDFIAGDVASFGWLAIGNAALTATANASGPRRTPIRVLWSWMSLRYSSACRADSR